MQNDKQKTAGKGKKVRGGFKTSEIARMFECWRRDAALRM